MLDELKPKRLSAATIVETVIALLILMISFAAGMVIYGKITGAGVNQRRLQASMETESVVDSLLATGGFQEQVIPRADRSITIRLKADQNFEDALVMQALCLDAGGEVLAEISKIVSDEQGED